MHVAFQESIFFYLFLNDKILYATNYCAEDVRFYIVLMLVFTSLYLMILNAESSIALVSMKNFVDASVLSATLDLGTS
jgi:hypothetical protein